MNKLFGFIFLFFMTATSSLWAQNKAVTDITIKAIPGLKYDIVKFQVKPGSKVRLKLTNADDMSHNLLITKPGTRAKVVESALNLAEKGPIMNYIPKSSDVLWSIPVISPGQSQSLSFTAPAKPGLYPYVCTYPGHGYIMFGVMEVTDQKSPALKKVPPAAKKVDAIEHSQHAAVSPHPYELKAPYWYRVFIEGASPAAIAVHLPQNVSYCWDAEVCKLRYAWKGDFVDNADLWKGHFDASAKVLGDVFYRDNTVFPLLLGMNAEIPKVSYKGYRIIDRHPEFHYTVDGVDVFELIQSTADGNGLIRRFRIPDISQSIWFERNREDEAIRYESTAGKWNGSRLMLTADEAREFTITMSSYHLKIKKKQ